MSTVLVSERNGDDGSSHALRRLAFDETLVQQLDNDVNVEGAACDGTSPDRKVVVRSPAPPTTRKGQVPMSRARYDALAATLLDRRTSREKAHAAMRRDIANCLATVKRLEEEEQPRVLTESQDSYEWLLSCLEGSPSVREYFADLTSPSRTPPALPSVQSLHASSPTVAVKALSPIFDRAAELETRCGKQKSLKVLQQDVVYQRERARLRSERIDDELATMMKSIEAADHQRRRTASTTESRLAEVAHQPTLVTLEANRAQQEQSLIAARSRLEAQQHALDAARQRLDDDAIRRASLSATLQRVHADALDRQRQRVVVHAEPKARDLVRASEETQFTALSEACLHHHLALETASTDRQLKRNLEQLNELRRLAGVGAGDCTEAVTTTTVSELRNQRNNLTAEVRSANAKILCAEEGIKELAEFVSSSVDDVDETTLAACLSDVAAKESILEQKRALMDDAVRANQERCAIDRWLGSEVAADNEAALRDVTSLPPGEDPMPTLDAYRTLRRQCLLLGKELSNVNDQQQRQEHFTSLGLYHTLHRELADVTDRAKALEAERDALEAEIAALKCDEQRTVQHRASLVAQENAKMQAIDALRVVESDALHRNAALVRQLGEHEELRHTFRTEEAAHMQRRQRRYLECMGILERPCAPATSSTVAAVAAPTTAAHINGGRQAAPTRSREEVLAAATRTGLDVPDESKVVGHAAVTLMDALPSQQLEGKEGNVTRWWWPFGSHAAPRRDEHRGPSAV